MPDSIQEQIVKNVVNALGRISTVNGYANTIALTQRLNQSGVDLAAVPTLLVKEGECTVESGASSYPNVRRRMELFVVIVTRQDETPTSTDTRDGGAILNSLVADVETVLANNRTWDGLAIQTDPPSYIEVDMDATTPHLARGVRCEILYEHVRTNPYSQS